MTAALLTPPPVQPLPLVNGHDLVFQGKLPEPLVEGLLMPKSLNLLSAEPFTGKTFFLMELARAVATGTKFMGRYQARQGAVLFIAEDGSHWSYAIQWKKVAGLTNLEEGARVAEAKEVLHTPEATDFYPTHALVDRVRFSVLNGVQLDVLGVERIARAANSIEHSLEDRPTGVHEDLSGQVPATGQAAVVDEQEPLLGPEIFEPSCLRGVSLILVDTFRAAFGGNENDNGEVQFAMNRLRRLIEQTGATVVLSHHLNKPNPHMSPIGSHRVRGASSLIGAVDGHIQLREGSRNKGAVTIDAHQLKDRAGSDEPGFRFEMVYDDSSATFEWLGSLAEAKENKARQQSQLTEDCQAILTALAEGSKTKAQLAAILSTGSDPAKPRKPDSLRTAATRALNQLLVGHRVDEGPGGYCLVPPATAVPEGPDGPP